jgi:signal transduction histidine kinase
MSRSSIVPANAERAARAREIRAQRDFVDQLSRNPATVGGNIEVIARLITETCAALLDVERTGVWLFAEAETELRCFDQYNLSTGQHSSGAVIYEHELREEFQALKSSLYVDAGDPYRDPRTAGYVERYLEVNGITSMLDLVIRFGGKNLGTLCFEHVGKPHTWEQHEIDFGCMVASQLSILLERREGQRTERARLEMQERLRATQELTALKSRFLANISHEFRTPLTLLLGPVDDLISSERSPPSEWQKDQLLLVRRNAHRLLKLVNALLDFVRVEAGRAQAAFEPTDLAALTRDLAGLFGDAAERAGLTLRVESDPLPEPVWVDREMWEKIVQNLLSNALKYTLSGEIRVTLSAAKDGVVLVVRDTGVGIPGEALPHVFERFYRVPEARGRTMEGAGIGLALVKELVELHGGTIRAESTPGSGSTFRVAIPRGHDHLPRELVRTRLGAARQLAPCAPSAIVEEVLGWLPERAPPEEHAPERAAGEAPRARILVADDNADMRAYLVRLLADRYDVKAVADGREALAEARARPPDLVLCDVMMPMLDGIALLRALRADPVTTTVPVVLVSARAGDEAAVEALVVGADDYLSKPFSARELLARVSTHLALARARREAAEAALQDAFLGIAGHELRTPLTTLKLRVQVARQKLAAARPAEAAQQLAQLGRSIARMDHLVGELLSVSAIKAGRLTLALERCDLAAVCRDAAQAEEAALGRAATLDLPEGAVIGTGDRERLTEVVEHLLSNALRYSPRGRPVTLSLRRQGEDAVIAVRDEGPGIPAHEVPLVFERFHRVPGISVQVGSRVGLGLGLFIAKALVEQHGGRIDVDTKPGGPTTFVVTLPWRATGALPNGA